ncbi:hypothetical protein ACFQ15_08800 [Sphingomonas hankookensis]|uniref:hypothetical protein n=1 Tax=Sphingomonas hankookensis TaxID=563996 RepID=UPI001F55B74C|nr:hypothetical protein [Sphingomonas hankookensis]
MDELPAEALDRIAWEDASLIEIRLTSAGIDLVMLADISGAVPRTAGEEFGYFILSFAGIQKLDMPLRFAHFVPAEYPRDELPDLGGIHSLAINTLPGADRGLPPRHRMTMDWAYGTISFECEAVRATMIAERAEG